MDGSAFPDRPDLVTAKSFWHCYTGDENTPIRIALLHAVAWPEELKREGRYSPYPPIEREGTLDQLWPLIVEKQREGYACYFFANATPPGFFGNIRNRDVTAIRSLHIDCDNGLPSEFHVTPSAIVRTSLVIGDNGQPVQKGAAFWLVHDMPKDEFSKAQAELIAHYGSDRQVKDAKRVMRLPGSVHRKPAISGADLRAQLIASPTKETVDAIPLSPPQLVTFVDPLCPGLYSGPMSAKDVLTGLSGTGSSSSTPTGPSTTPGGDTNLFLYPGPHSQRLIFIS